MKKANFVINIALVPIDFALLIAAATSAYFLRFSDSITQIRPVFYEMPFETYFGLAWKVALAGIIIFAFFNFYTMSDKKLAKELPRIFTGVSMLAVFLILAIFLSRELFSSRFIIILAWALAIVYLFIARVFVFWLRNYFFKIGRGLSSVIVLGQADLRNTIINEYKLKPSLGYQVVGHADNLTDLESNSELMKLVEERRIDNIVETDSAISKTYALDLLTFCQENHITLSYVASLFQAQSINFDLSSLAGIPFITIKGTPLDGWRRVGKRLFDLVLSIILLAILSPLFLVLAIVIKSNSKGPVFVALPRVGSKGKIFQTYKFRSMIENAHELKSEMMKYNERLDGPLFKMKNDPRITSVGKWLRRTSLDELPQLLNVVKGQMSLVGPRPHEPEEVSRYQRGYKKLLEILPGMTGMAQVSGRSNLPFAEEAKLDIFYIENWSLLLDLIILLKTAKVVIRQDQAY